MSILQFILRTIVHLFVTLNYRVKIKGGEIALECMEGAIVVPNHISRIDAPLLMSEAWPHAILRPTAWHAEYSHWIQYPLMKLFRTIALGSPKTLPADQRKLRTAKAKTLMDASLSNNEHLVIFAEGSIGDGEYVRVPVHFSGIYDLVKNHPDKPVLIVNIYGLQYSRFGKAKPRAPLFSRIPVIISIKHLPRLEADTAEQFNVHLQSALNSKEGN